MSEVLSKFSCDHIPEGDSCGLVVTLVEQNAKLRELVRAAWGCIHSGLSCSDCRMIAGGCTLQSTMHELRVGVDE